MLQNAGRFYPIIRSLGSFRLALFHNKAWLEVPNASKNFCNCRHQDSDGFYYYAFMEMALENQRFYGTGFEDLKMLGKSNIRGIPMLQDVDFDSILNFANPIKQFEASLVPKSYAL